MARIRADTAFDLRAFDIGWSSEHLAIAAIRQDQPHALHGISYASD